MTDNARFATRFLLFGEIILGWLSMSWAMSALFGSGDWWRAMSQGSVSQWAWALLSVGFCQCAVAVVEMCCGRQWSDIKLQAASEARHFVAVMAVIFWVVLAFHFFVVPNQPPAPAIAMQAIALVVANVFVAINNKRLAVLLDPEFPTEQLRSRLIDARRSGNVVL